MVMQILLVQTNGGVLVVLVLEAVMLRGFENNLEAKSRSSLSRVESNARIDLRSLEFVVFKSIPCAL